jgi:hypothetical protein
MRGWGLQRETVPHKIRKFWIGADRLFTENDTN